MCLQGKIADFELSSLKPLQDLLQRAIEMFAVELLKKEEPKTQ